MFPNGAEFAFTILDDTDDTTLVNGPPVYELLRANGLRTTKTVWTVDVPPERRGIFHAGETLATPGYREWVGQLQRAGFEIAFHNAAMSSSTRDTTIRALDELRELLGDQVRLHCNHGQNRENLFWGAARYQSLPFNLLARLRGGEWRRSAYEGELVGSPYYWADVANETFAYIRSMAFQILDCSEIQPERPFRDLAKLSKPVFFNTADAPDCTAFNRLVNKQSINELHRNGGWSIVSTHIGKGFCTHGQVDAQFAETIRYLAQLPGWFVPASELLDFLVDRDGCAPLSFAERLRMEGFHAVDRLKARS